MKPKNFENKGGDTVKGIMTKDPVCCAPDATLQEVAQYMCDLNCGEIPVIDGDRKPIGVITDRDITCRTIAKGVNPYEMTAGDCMTRNCVTVGLNASLEECCAILEEHQIRRLPVVDEYGRCVGIVAQADIARFAPKEKTGEVLQEVSKNALPSQERNPGGGNI